MKDYIYMAVRKSETQIQSKLAATTEIRIMEDQKFLDFTIYKTNLLNYKKIKK